MNSKRELAQAITAIEGKTKQVTYSNVMEILTVIELLEAQLMLQPGMAYEGPIHTLLRGANKTFYRLSGKKKGG